MRAILITSLMTSFAVTIPTRLPCLASTTGRACSLLKQWYDQVRQGVITTDYHENAVISDIPNTYWLQNSHFTLKTHRCFAIVSAAIFIKSFVVTVTGSLVIISCTVCPKILLAVSESSSSPNVTKLPLSSLGRKSNELTNPTRRQSTLSGFSAFLRRSMTGAPDTPAWRRVAMASSTGVCGASVKRWGWDVMRSETMRFVDLEGVDMNTRCCCCCLSETEKERQCPTAWRSRRNVKTKFDMIFVVVVDSPFAFAVFCALERECSMAGWFKCEFFFATASVSLLRIDQRLFVSESWFTQVGLMKLFPACRRTTPARAGWRGEGEKIGRRSSDRSELHHLPQPAASGFSSFINVSHEGFSFILHPEGNHDFITSFMFFLILQIFCGNRSWIDFWRGLIFLTPKIL